MVRFPAYGRPALLAILIASSPITTGCMEDPDASLGDEVASRQDGVIIGDNDLVPVNRDGGNVPARYRASLDGFGRLLVGGAACSATHVGGGIAISAGHCFNAPNQRVDDRPCPNTKVEWGYRGGAITLVSNCTRILAMRVGGNQDYAIFRVSPVPSVTLDVKLDSPPTNGLPLTIFSHPQAKPLNWSRTCSVMSSGGTEISYQCDTQGGSSGASVLRDDTLQVVGIHWGGGGNSNVATKLTSTPLGEFLGDDPPPPGDVVRFVSRPSSKCLDVNGSGTADGTQIQLWSCNGTGAQSFELQDAGGGQFAIVNTSSGKCVDVSGSGTANGTKIQLWTCNGTGAQRFSQQDAGGGFARLVNANSGKCLDVSGNGTADGTVVHLWQCGGGQNQQWRGEEP